MEEETYEVIVHLIDGKKLKVSERVTASSLMESYRVLGADEGRIKLPTGRDTMQFLPASSVLRIEAIGNFD